MRYFMMVLSLIVSLSFWGGTAMADSGSQIYIDVGQAKVKKSLLALTPLQYLGSQPTNTSHIRIGQNLYNVIYNDLNVSNLFTYIKPDAYLENPAKIGLRPAPGEANGFKFENWKTIGTEFLIRAGYQVLGNQIKLEIYAYHVPTAKLILGKTYEGSESAYRKIAHTFANDFIKALTGKEGPYLTKIVASHQAPGSSVKEIYVMDWDGANPKQISFHHSIAISPAWSNDGTQIAYTAFAYHSRQKMRNPDLFIYHLDTGKRFLVSYRKGMNSGSDFFPDDRELLLTLSKDGAADIYKATADGKTVTPLTHGPNRSMNVEAAISPDGKTIAFSSDRSGRPMIYLMDTNGHHVRRLTFAGKYNASPAWSPDGKTIAFAAQDKDHFDIFTMSTNGTELKRLTSAKRPNGTLSNNESPSWSPDGRNILFTSDRSGKYQLYIVSPDGTDERRITDDSNSWDRPKWSPFLK